MRKALVKKCQGVIILAILFVVLAFAFILKASWDIDRLDSHYARLDEDLLIYKWNTVESVFDGNYKQLYEMAMSTAATVTRDTSDDYKGDLKRLEFDLLDIPNGNFSPIVESITKHTVGTFYGETDGDANDMFSVVLGFDPMVVADGSINCSAFGRTRTFEEEFSMHANKDLARIAFGRIESGDIPNFSSNVFNRPIFFQFTPNYLVEGDVDLSHIEDEELRIEEFKRLAALVPPAYPITSYDMRGLRQAFLEADGDFDRVFRVFEFIAPAYINPTADLAGVPRVEMGIKQDAKVIAINAVFNLVDVMNTLPKERVKLAMFDSERKHLSIQYDMEERYILGTTMLIILLAFVVLGVAVKMAFKKGE